MALVFASARSVLAASVSVRGKAKSLNTANSYIDFTNYNSNVSINNSTGVFSGYAFSEDLGWFAFGTTDNSDGPVTANLTSGVVTGKAKSLTTGALLDFSNYNSNVTVNISTGVFSGHVFSVDLGWFDFSDTGVNTGSTTLDSVAPSSFALIDPADNSYSPYERPSFRWRASSSDAIGSISKYRLWVDNGETGDFAIDNIPVSRTDDYVTSMYTAHYEGFGDSDANNNYITVTTKSSSDWPSDQNDGKAKEGKRRWTVQAYDSNGNSVESSFTLFVDRTAPNVALTHINTTNFSGVSMKTADTTPRFSGRVTDRLNGDSEANDVASGPRSLEIKFEKKSSFDQYTLHSLANMQFSELHWESDGSIIEDNKLQDSNKYALFMFTPEALDYGEYRVTLKGIDIAGNGGGEVTFLITIVRPSTGSGLPFTPTPEPLTEEELEIVVPAEPVQPTEPTAEATPAPPTLPAEAAGPSFVSQISGFFSGIFSTMSDWWSNTIAFFRGIPVASWFGNVLAGMTRAGESIFGFTGRMMAGIFEGAGRLGKYTTNTFQLGQRNIAQVINRQKEFAQGLGQWWSYTTEAFSEIVLRNEPTRITDVQIVEVGVDYAVITWKTNHYTKNNKINYGKDTSYGQNAFAPDYEKEHTVRLEGLEPGSQYAFEVMSQNKNYVYDAHHEFTTQKTPTGE